MTIQNILNNKGDEIITIGAEQSVREALQVMTERRIGALMVSGDDKSCQGIFTERDVIRALASSDAVILDEMVKAHMTKRPQSIVLKTSVDEAMAIMTKRRFRHLPVMNGKALCGIVSIGDLVNFRIQQTEMEARAMKQYITNG